MKFITVVNDGAEKARPVRAYRSGGLQGARSRLLLSAAVAALALSAIPQKAQAACVGADPPYEITAQNTTVDLDTDCAGDGGGATVTGDIDGNGGDGISDADGGKQDWAITVNESVTVQGDDGISLESPNPSVDNSGTIIGVTDDGVDIVFGATVINRATGTITSGSSAVNLDGFSTVDNYGLIESTGLDGIAVNLKGGGSVTNEGTIDGDRHGIRVNGDTGTLTNDGTISSYRDAAVVLNAGGSFTNNSGGDVTSDGGDAVQINGGTVTITNAGTLQSNDGNGAHVAGGTGTVINQNGGSITATDFGVFIETAGGSVTNSGTITSQFDAGIYMEAGGMVTNTATGMITGNDGDGVLITAGSGTVDNSGTIAGAGFGSRGVYIDNGGTLTNRAGGIIQSDGFAGVTVDHDVTVDNAGTITGSSGWGLEMMHGGTIINRAGGLIEGDDHGIITTFAITLENAGTITSATANGIVLAGGTVTNTGTVTGDNIGIEVGGATSITNSGSITGTSSSGIYSNAGGSVTNEFGGTITGGEDGIFLRVSTGSVINSGQITGDNDESGVELEAGGTVINNAGGDITGDAEGVMISGASGTVTNSGTITGLTNFGVTLRAGGTVTNLDGGTIRGASGLAGVHIAGASGTVDNAGEITGDDDEGVELTAGGTIVNRFGGLIEGEADQAIEVSGGAANVINAGRINSVNATSGNTVLFADFDDRFEIQPGSSVTNDDAGTIEAGVVEAGAGTDTLAFGGTSEGEFELGDIDTGANTQQYRNFEQFEVVGGKWSFTGGTTETFDVTGGTLMGTGTFGGLNVMNGGTIAPGNSIGTMTVNGAFTLGSGAAYEVEVNADGEGDKVIVNGTVNLTGATLRVLAANGDYKDSTNYTIIENDDTDAVVGTFATVTSSLAFLTPTVFYAAGDGNDVVLNLERNETTFADVARTYNQRAVAGALSQFPADNALFLAVLNQTAEGARHAFDALSGEIHATVAGTLADDSHYVREAVLGRLMQASHSGEALSAGGPQVASLDAQAYALGFDGKSLIEPAPTPLAFWTRAYGAWGAFNGDGKAATADRDLGGFVSGMDAEIGNGWRAGLATGASFANVDVDARYSSADVESYHLGGYVGGMASAFALRGGGMWAWNDIDTSRAVVFPGFFERQKASYDADTGQLFGEVAYPTQMGGLAVEPFGGLAYVTIDTGSFKEHGGALASLRGSDADQDVGYSTLGVRAATTMMFGDMQLVPHFSAAWQHAFDDVTPGAALAFASTGIGFGIEGVPLAQDSALIDAGLDFALGERTTAGVSYTGQFGDGVSDNGVKGRFTWLF